MASREVASPLRRVELVMHDGIGAGGDRRTEMHGMALDDGANRLHLAPREVLAVEERHGAPGRCAMAAAQSSPSSVLMMERHGEGTERHSRLWGSNSRSKPWATVVDLFCPSPQPM